MRKMALFLAASWLFGCGGDEISIDRSTTSGSTSSGQGGAGGMGGFGGAGGAGDVGGGGGTAGGSPLCSGKNPVPPGNMDFSIETSGEMRDYRVHVPPGYDAKSPVALLVALHGYTEKIDDFMATSHFAEAVDKRNMIVVFPQGKAPLGVPGWNAGTCCGTAQIQMVPDVQFIRDMVDQIEANYCIDPKRIFVSGFSNGGMLSHRLACEFSERVAAIGAVSGTMAIDPCIPKRPVPVLHIHGTSDVVVPYNNPLTAQTVPKTIDGWVARDFCQQMTSVAYWNGSAKCELYGPCDADVELCTIEGGSHEWPGGGSAMGAGDINATEYILDFLEAHPMP